MTLPTPSPPKFLFGYSLTDVLQSEIVARDFFPGLLEAKHQQEYLDALDSQDPEWIAEASRKLSVVMTPNFRNKQRRMSKRGTSFTPTAAHAAWARLTPTPRFGSTPGMGVSTPGSVRSVGTNVSTATSVIDEKVKPDLSLSLDAFQAKYTSEDNASFNDILDRQNEKRRNAYSWMWNGNKIPGNRSVMANRILKERGEKTEENEGSGSGEEGGEEKKSIGWVDDRKAAPETWRSKPRNGLMFVPEGVEDTQLALPPTTSSTTKEEHGKQAALHPPKSIAYSNTRMPPPPPPIANDPPPSPSFSAIQDAIAGNPRGSTSSVIEDGNATPRINGYSFVDDAPSKDEMDAFNTLYGNESQSAPTPSLTGPSPFKIAATPRRELLLNKMVDKAAKAKRSSTALENAAKIVGGVTPGSRTHATPLTPAGHRLLSSVGKKPGMLTDASPFGEARLRSSRKHVGEETPRMPMPVGLLGKSKPGVKATPRN